MLWDNRAAFALLLFHVNISLCNRLLTDFWGLAVQLPGIYSNEGQYINDVFNDLPSDKRHNSMRTVLRPIRIRFLKNAFNVYAEQYVNHARKPFRRDVYSFSVDEKKLKIIMRKYSFLPNKLARRYKNYYRLFRKLNDSFFEAEADCDLYWRRMNNKTFVGVTKKGCMSHVNTEKVYKSLSMTLTPKHLQSQESWYRATDGKKMYEMTTPYKLAKIKSYKGHRFFPRELRRRIRPHRHHRRKRKRHKTAKSHNMVFQKSFPSKILQGDDGTQNRYQKDTAKLMSVLKELASNSRTWQLRDFKSILDALTSGHIVRYAANLDHCKITGEQKTMTAFGDTVDIYRYIVDTAHNHMRFLQFSKKRVISGKYGARIQLRDIRMYPNGNVIIDITDFDKLQSKIYNHSIIHCRLYNPDTRFGDIRFTTNPLRDVNVIENFPKLLGSINQGETVRMTLDTSQCEGKHSMRIRKIVGGGIKGYDIVGDNEKITFSWEVLHLQRGHLGQTHLQHRFQLHSIYKNNTATFAELTDHHFNSFSERLDIYMCKVDSEDNMGSLRLFSSPNVHSIL